MTRTAVNGGARSRVAFVLAVAALGVGLMGPAQAADPAAVTKRVGVVLVNFRNDQSRPFTAVDAGEWTFGGSPSVAGLFRAVSAERLAV